jgi:hypothetical protein
LRHITAADDGANNDKAEGLHLIRAFS